MFCPRTQQGQGDKSCIYSITSLFSTYPWQGTMVWGAQRWKLYLWFLPCRESAGAISVLWIMSLDSKDQGLEEKVSPLRFLEIVGYVALERWVEFWQMEAEGGQNARDRDRKASKFKSYWRMFDFSRTVVRKGLVRRKEQIF